ncbi:MAG: hypothetical protein ABIT20_22340 [Gemmatimonadaceae bacterium]
MSGILTSALWQVNGSQLSYAGSVSAQARITQDKAGAVHQQLEQTSISTAPTSAPTQRFGRSLLTVPSTNKLALPEGAQVSWRTQFKSPRENLTLRDGKRVSLQRVADPRGGGRPPVATMLYDGDRPVSLIEAQYLKEGKRWKATKARITLFGKDGKPSAVTESNLAALQTASVALPGTPAAFADGFRRVGGSLSRLIQPDVLFAATTGDDDGGRCWSEWWAMMAAGAAQTAADIALGSAITACGAFIVTCPAIAGALLAVTATAATYLLRVIAYDQCMNPPQPIIAAPGGGGTGGEGDGCYEAEWQISWDGGWSWHHYSFETICERSYAM